METLLEWA